MKQKAVIFSCGHSNKPFATFLDKLADHKIEVLVDVRTMPLSRRCPHFNKNALHRALANVNIQYLWKGENLGGRGINVDYEETIDELVGIARKGTRVAVMCSEGDYHNCHRYTTLTPSFEERGATVVHIEYENAKKIAKRNK